MSPDERELWQEVCLSVLRGTWEGSVERVVIASIKSANMVIEGYREADKTIGLKPGEIINVTPPKGRS